MEVITRVLSQFGYCFDRELDTGLLFINAESPSSLPAILVDTHLFSKCAKDYPYIYYTSEQNRLMHQHEGGLLRFLFDDENQLAQDLETFLVSEPPETDIRVFGQAREENHLDPTPPEFNFALIFEEVFGAQALHALKPEVSVIDRAGVRRYVDYELTKSDCTIAIELNGERYHHPLFTGREKYKSQLFKQNSLVSDGIKVFRWSNRGMADRAKITDQMREYFGSADTFKSNPAFHAKREISTFDLYEHQEQALERINKERIAGKNTFLVVLPTGTGKTEVFIEDMREQITNGSVKRVLVLVPTTALKAQTIGRITKHIPTLRVGESLSNTDVTVQTNAGMLRQFRHIPSNYFDYVLVDEAHRAAAHGLRKVLEHFMPKTLIGLTATDERLDRQKLEDIFGSYEVDLTLAEAIKKGIVPPIRAFRLKSNIDLSAVRFNGKDYVKSDLNKTVQVESRDQLIVDVLLKYFSEPLQYAKPISQGIIFCVDVRHTERMAKLLNKNGIPAASVHAKNRSGLADYANKSIRFLCACELLNEGWDAPQTEVVVMARPTMSKVLYTQQLGRGTRNYPGKEALYVIDVVDSYGAALAPFSVHSLLQIPYYMPFADVIEPHQQRQVSEITILEGLYEQVRTIEPVNIFNFTTEFGDLLNEEQLARELFISTSTLKSWVKKGDVQPTRTIPFGRAQLHYFEPELIQIIRAEKGLKERTEESRHDDFFEFLEQRDYTFSYKIVFLLALLKHIDGQGEAKLENVTATYQQFYQGLFNRFGRAEKGNNPLNKLENLQNSAYMQRSMLQNPFEKFERKRFVYHCEDLAFISFDSVLWERLTKSDIDKIKDQMAEDGVNYFAKLEVQLEKSDFELIG